MAVPSENEEPQVAPGAGEDSHRQNTPPGCGSDGENERTTREQLKKTSIAGLSQQARDSADVAAGEETVGDDLASVAVQNGNPRGRPSKKRSFEDIKDEQASPANGSTDTKRGGAHKRMRSREITHDGELPLGYGNATNAGSPLHEESDGDAQSFPGGSGVLIDSDIPSDTNAQTAPTVEEKILDKEDTTNEPSTGVGAETRLSSTSVQEPKSDAASQPSAATAVKASLNPGSGFANTSTASPFGAVKSPPPTESDAKAASSTSPSAFASSGLAAFASQDKSPFGAAGSTISTGGFGGGSSGFGGGGSTFGKPTSGFGSGGGFGAGGPPSSFGSNASPFGGRIGLGGPASGGFGADKGFGGGSVPKPFGGAPARFGKSQGVKSDEEDDAESDNEHDQHVDQSEEEKPDSRFHQQEVETGEEGEDTVFSARAKLYHFEKEWKERGTGVIKVNVRQEPVSRVDDTENATADIEAGDDGNFELKARVIMRSDGVHRVILNSPVFKDMKVGTQDGDEPNGKTMFLTGMDEGKPRLFQIKMGKEDTLRELYYRISEFKDIL